MTAAQIQARVDARLRARGPLNRDSPRRLVALVGQWRRVCSVFGADSDAAVGVLLGFVGESHGREVWYSYRGDGRFFVHRSVVMSLDGEVVAGAGELVEALIAALESAP